MVLIGLQIGWVYINRDGQTHPAPIHTSSSIRANTPQASSGSFRSFKPKYLLKKNAAKDSKMVKSILSENTKISEVDYNFISHLTSTHNFCDHNKF